MISLNKQRIFLSIFFFISGFSFSSLASRIPTIKTFFGFNEAELGTLLLAMPVSSLIGLPISGWLVSRFDSRIPLAVACGMNAISLAFVGFSPDIFRLVIGISLFSFSMRIFNISVNTQAITLQKKMGTVIMGSFHGLWSTGGIFGVGVATLLLSLNVSIQMHLLAIAMAGLTITVLSYQFLLRNDRSTTGNKLKLGKPDLYIVYLGLLVFFAALCEGGMFDWSGIYFKEVLNVRIFTYGYLIFMVFMATSRFLSDMVINKIGLQATYIISSACIILGIGVAIILPTFMSAMIGFSLVGLGTAAVVPMTYMLAGRSKKYSP
ncbi:MFS transporter, partial [Flavihumibacter sp. R14]|nr:MFS transporter [Flavihumibacter soli]